MAVLNNAKRREVWAQLMSDESSLRESLVDGKATLRTLINQIDGAFEDFLTAVTRGRLSEEQTLRLVRLIVSKKLGG
jgi:hypothetical protein